MKKAAKRKLVKAVSYVLGLTLSLSVGTFIKVPDTSFAVSASSDSINEKKDKIKDLKLQNRQIDNAIAALGSDISHSYVVIDNGDGYSTLYGHCSDVYVSVGQQVEQGEAIGAVGNTGNSTGPHLHFEVRVNNVPQDPFNYVRKFW